MIYASTQCVRSKNISDIIEKISSYGIKNIEITGGTDYYPEIFLDIKKLKNRYQLNLRLHNYFPPPTKHFVLNLCSRNNFVLNSSKELIKKALEFSHEIESNRYGIHAGFRLSPGVDELGRSFKKDILDTYEDALKLFFDNYSQMDEYAKKLGIKLYIENNVFSKANFETFNGVNPFLLTDYKEYIEKFNYQFNLLMDVAHLKVTSNTLGLNFLQELENFWSHTDYLHISDNNGLEDSNEPLKSDSPLFQFIKEKGLKDKTITLEISDDIEALIHSQQLIEKYL